MRRDELVSWLDDYLAVDSFPDKSLNGLQVEGKEEVQKVVVAVDASYNTFEMAVAKGGDMLIVHHGLFWGQPLAITGPHKRRVQYLLDNGLSLYAAHLPLDAHVEVGNNWGLARRLDMRELEGFVPMAGAHLGVKGQLPQPTELRVLAEQIEKELGEQVMVHAGGPDPVTSLAIVSGGAAWEVVRAADEGLDAFLTGEPKHETFYESFERGISAMFAGHYMTETVGVQLLAEKLEAVFGLETEFVMLPTGL
ncbi:MAG TPA: Nif3-like dinuclear metal center hexameric protein [Trueperaceae bacterium]|nr:Nif3-like dinuclear metal center hexameric protein [Trueperaceae bacterium]